MQRRDALIGLTGTALAQFGSTDAQAANTPAQANAPEPTLYRCAGRIMQAWFTTAADLRTLIPPAFELKDPHRAFIKVYELKYGAVGRPYLPPAFSQYRQVCATVLAAPPGHEPMHINLFMWEQRGWSMQGTGNATWNKKLAEIEVTALYPVEEMYRDPASPTAFVVDVATSGAPLMHFSGVLDGTKRVEPPPLNGFYFGGEAGQDIFSLKLREPYLGKPWHGRGELKFWAAPNETVPPAKGDWSAATLGEVKVEGFAVQDVMFLRDYRDLQKIPAAK